jgi:hypothetical protein
MNDFLPNQSANAKDISKLIISPQWRENAEKLGLIINSLRPSDTGVNKKKNF